MGPEFSLCIQVYGSFSFQNRTEDKKIIDQNDTKVIWIPLNFRKLSHGIVASFVLKIQPTFKYFALKICRNMTTQFVFDGNFHQNNVN